MAYDNPNATVRREWFINAAAGANAEYKFRTFQKIVLKKVHAVAVTAGTTAGHTMTVYNGTTSIGALTLTTNTAGSTFSTAALNSTVDALGLINIKNGTDATGAYHAILEYEVLHDATQS